MGTTGSGTGTAITGEWSIIRDRMRRELKDEKEIVIDGCNAAWTAATNVTCTADTTYYKEGTASAKMALADGFSTGIAAYKDLTTPLDLSQAEKVVFWIMPSIDTITAGQLEIVLCLATAGNGQTENLDVPAMGTKDVWYRFSVDLVDPSDLSAVVCVGLNATADVGACNVYLDRVVAEYGSYRWTDDALDAHIERAVRDLSHELPRKRMTTLRSIKSCHKHEDETNVISSSSASTLATAYTKAAEITDDHNAHCADTDYHKAADSTNLITADDPDSKATLVTWCVQAKAKINAHFVEDGVHYVDDETNAITDDDAHGDDSTSDLCDKVNNIGDGYEDHLEEESNGAYVDISSLTSLLAVEAVEYPINSKQPSYVPFEPKNPRDFLKIVGATTPSHNDEPVRVHWDAVHTSSSLEDYQEDVVALGAEGYALQEWSAYATNRANVGEVANFAALGSYKLTLFKQELARYKSHEPRKATQMRVWDYGV